MSRKVQKVILLVDSSGSMNGQPIDEAKKSIKALSRKLRSYENSVSRVDLQIISFATTAKYISRNAVDEIQADGRTNLAEAYENLNLIFRKHSSFDFPPIIVLLCDGQPNLCDHDRALRQLYKNCEFRHSLRIAFAYGEQTYNTLKILSDFTGAFRNVFQNGTPAQVGHLIEKSIPSIIKAQAKNCTQNEELSRIIARDISRFKGRERSKYETCKRQSYGKHY